MNHPHFDFLFCPFPDRTENLSSDMNKYSILKMGILIFVLLYIVACYIVMRWENRRGGRWKRRGGSHREH